MAVQLTMGTPQAQAIQTSIQKELAMKGYSTESDPVMAEYITIMLINSKTPDQITTELTDLIGSEYDPKFTDWLFAEAANQASEPESELVIPPTIEAKDEPEARQSSREPRPANGGLFQQALSASTSLPASKRLASKRSPSPNSNGPSKSRRISDLPDRPRAMRDDNQTIPVVAEGSRPRTLLDRVGPPQHGRQNNNVRGFNNRPVDRVQAQIDAVTMTAMENGMPMNGGYPMMGMPGMEMNMAGFNPMMMQEMMATQMAMMAQMANTLNVANGMPFNNGGFAPQGFNPNGPQQGRQQGGQRNGQHRGQNGGPNAHPQASITPVPETAPPHADSARRIHAPKPSRSAPEQPPQNIPTRPLSPTLCKFNAKCASATCRYSHPSPVATQESGIVLSAEACEKGVDCKDKDCTKSHTSPAVSNGTTVPPPKAPAPTQPQYTPAPQYAAAAVAAPSHHFATPCKFGNACTRPGCSFTHPRDGYAGKPCRFAAACTRADCTFSHPPGRTLPGSFAHGQTFTRGGPGVASTGAHKTLDLRAAAAPFVPKAKMEAAAAAKEEGEVRALLSAEESSLNSSKT